MEINNFKKNMKRKRDVTKGLKDEEDSESFDLKRRKTNSSSVGISIHPKNLDFDGLLDKVCSISLKRNNIYCCLNCGKFYQGRLDGTPAFVHASKNEGHEVFVNLSNRKVFSLPENKEIVVVGEDEKEKKKGYMGLLKDIQFNIDPKYDREKLMYYEKIYRKKSNESQVKFVNYFGDEYVPGFVGLNCKNSSINVIFQMISSLRPLKFFLLLYEYKESTPILNGFSEMMKKLWNYQRFKKNYDPNALISRITIESEKEFEMLKYCDPKEFLMWLINRINKESDRFLNKFLKGRVFVKTKRVEILKGKKEENVQKDEKVKNFEKTHSYYCLTCDVPKLKDSTNTILLEQVLAKFNGEKETIKSTYDGDLDQKIYKIKKLPEFLIIHCNRFQINKFFKEKLSTIIKIPLTNLDLSRIFKMKKKNMIYDLRCNIIHQGQLKQKMFSLKGGINPTEHGNYKIQVLDEYRKKWYEIQNEEIKEIFPESIEVSESFILVYERRK